MEQVNNPLPTSSKLVQVVHPKHIYIFLEMSTIYAQHESLKKTTLLFEQVALVVQTWP
jgi:hypothetical protein